METKLSVVDTLRVSVTDRCNLRCIYCTPGHGVVSKSHEDILRFEEMARIIRAAVRGGVAGLGLADERVDQQPVGEFERALL